MIISVCVYVYMCDVGLCLWGCIIECVYMCRAISEHVCAQVKLQAYWQFVLRVCGQVACLC